MTKTKIDRRGRFRQFPRVTVTFPEPSLAKQAMKQECDINFIMAKYKATGLVSHTNTHQGHYSELPSEMDYHADLLAVMAADDAFKSLPAAMRARFENDPAKFVGFVQDPANQAEINKMGLGVKADLPPGAPAPKEEDPPKSTADG